MILPTVALAADGGAPTIRGTIGADGAVKSIASYTPDGTASSFDGDMPVTMKITHTANGAAQTFVYHVENTFTQTQTLHYDDTAGNPHHTSVTLQLPLVGQLGVDVPQGMGVVTAPNAVVTTTKDGTRHVLWNMVLFSPVGSAIQDVTLNTASAGTPVAELRATLVNPQTTAGLSSVSQNATASYQQDDFWNGYASGANGGLTLIKDGLGQLLAGVQAGADGAQKLADGSAQALAGTGDLSDGIGQIYAGQGDLTKGLLQIHTGLNKTSGGLTGGLRQIHNGQGDLTDGLSKIHDGQSSLTDGLNQITDGQGDLTTGLGAISGGLHQVVDPATGLPAAVAGIQQVIDAIDDGTPAADLIAGVDQLLAGIGSDAANGTLLNGVVQVQGGLGLLKAGIQQQAGCASDILGKLKLGFAGGADACATGGVLPPLPAMADPFAIAVISGLITQFDAVAAGTDPTLTTAFGGLDAGLTAIHTGLLQVKGGLSTGNINSPGIREGLQLAKGGLAQIKTGVSTAVAGLGQLDTGAASAFAGSQALTAGSASALDGSQQLTAGSASALDGSQQLFDGSGKALAGSRKLFDGTGQALAGSKKLTAGSGKAFAGSKDLKSGLGQIADGQAQVAAGLPDAVDGISQLIDGVGQAQDGAVAPLAKQLAQASANSHKTLAVLQGATDLADSAPGGATATYVLSQNENAVSLAANNAGSSHTGRNIGIGAGGVVLLLVGLGTGLAMGRTRRTTAA